MAIYKITMGDGSQENVTLGMGALAELSRRQPEIYKRYRSLYKQMNGGEVDELGAAEFIYIGYRAANVMRDECLELAEFLDKMTDDREEIWNTFGRLFGMQEKKQASATPSARPRGKNRRQR